MKFINLTLILMLSIPSAQVLAIDSTTEPEEYINNSELDQYLNQDVFQLVEKTNYTEDMYGEKNNTIEDSENISTIDEKKEVIIINGSDGIEDEETTYTNEVATGRGYEDLQWSLDGTILTISGGIYEAQQNSVLPWNASSNKITKINITGPVTIKSKYINLFTGYPEVTTISGLENLKLEAPISLSSMFRGNRSLQSIAVPESFSTHAVTDMYEMFAECSSLQSITFPKSLDTSSVTDMAGMFAECSSLQSITFPNVFNTSSVINMTRMFKNVSLLKDSSFLEGFDTSKVTNMTEMFEGCSSFTSLSFPKSFDTSNVVSMIKMFDGCNSLKQLDLSSFDTNKVSLKSNMFNNCNLLTTLKLGSNVKSILETNLPVLSVSNGYIGLWKGEKTKTVFVSNTDFMENYTAELADSYIWSAHTDIRNYSVLLENQVYSGFDQTPSITLKSPSGLTQNVSYELAFSNNLNVGTANITIKGIGAYAGEINKTFEITPATPTIEKLPSTTDLMANSTLGESVISDGVVSGVGNDGKLTGQFKWKTPDHVVTASGEYTIVFTPVGVSEANYKSIETQVFVNVTKLSNVIPPVNIDHSSPPIDLENTNSDRGTGLSIRYVSGLDFGHKELSFSEQKLSAKEDQAVNKDTGTSETFENMITVEDGRGIRNGWVLTVRQYSEFNDGTVLEMNPNVDGRNGQGVFTGSKKLAVNGLSQTVAWAKNSESQMAGITSIGFGEVTLTIPKGGGVGEKQNSLIWELIDGPVPP